MLVWSFGWSCESRSDVEGTILVEEDLLRIIDKNLVEVLGRPAVQMIYGYLENSRGLRREEIPEKMDLYETELEKLLGEGAARIIVSKIKQEIAQEP